MCCYIYLCWIATETREIEDVYYLQRYKEDWKDGKWEEKLDVRKCIERNSFIQVTASDLLFSVDNRWQSDILMFGL